VRIATWNLAGRWNSKHVELLLSLDCDVLLLTEVSERVEIPAYVGHVGQALMAPRRRWAAVYSRGGLEPQPDPHPASALAVVDGIAFCSSVLPWRSCGYEPWGEGNHAARTERAVATLLESLPRDRLIWGGDFNHALEGREYAGSRGGRRSIMSALDALALTVPTAALPHQISSLLSIDHVAVPQASTVHVAERVSAVIGEGRLSDHDAYVVEVDL
jgi:hypothetical protein